MAWQGQQLLSVGNGNGNGDQNSQSSQPQGTEYTLQGKLSAYYQDRDGKLIRVI